MLVQTLRTLVGTFFALAAAFLLIGTDIKYGSGATLVMGLAVVVTGFLMIIGGKTQDADFDITVGLGLLIGLACAIVIVNYLPGVENWVEKTIQMIAG